MILSIHQTVFNESMDYFDIYLPSNKKNII
jgi:hypothetical protein